MTGDDAITIRDVYDAVQRTDGKVEAMNATMAAHVARTETQLDSGQRRLNDYETRLRVLEAAKSKLIGGAIVAGALSGLVAAVIEHH